MATEKTIKIQAVAHSYWRSIKRGKRTFESLSEEAKFGYPPMKEQVLYLAKSDVAEGVITEEEFEYYTGLVYAEVIAEEAATA